MIRKYPWHFVFAVFVVISLTNIFQKLKWSEATDGIVWNSTDSGLVCVEAPGNCPIQKGDILLTVNKYVIYSKVDLMRVLGQRQYCRYEVERKGLVKNYGIDISHRFTPLSYYILVFAGILFVLLSLGILNVHIRRYSFYAPPPIFYFLTLTFSGFLIFSPTGNYNLTDFVYYSLDQICFVFFPAVLLHYSLYFPVKVRFLKEKNARFTVGILYVIPIIILLLQGYMLVKNILVPETSTIVQTLHRFRQLQLKYFVCFLVLAVVSFSISNLQLILKKKQRRYLLPYCGLLVSITALLFLDLLPLISGWRVPLAEYTGTVSLIFMPLALVYFLSHKRFTDIQNIIRTTLSVSSLFIFIFGIYLFLGLNIEKNKLLGTFWAIAAILMAGLLFKPLEVTIQKYFERIFYRETFQFKRRLKELGATITTQRDPHAVSRRFLELVDEGFQLERSAVLIQDKEDAFLSLPRRRRMRLSRDFTEALRQRDALIFFSAQEFERKFPGDFRLMQDDHFYQFLPLKNNEKLIGLVAFGRKTDHTFLSMEDWELLHGISSALSLSLENAALYSRLENQLKELNLLKEFNENIIENINLGIVVLSDTQRIEAWNGFMENHFGLEADAVLHKRADAAFGAELWERIQRATALGPTVRNLKVNREEQTIFFDMFVSPLKNLDGSVSGNIMVFEDMTEKNLIQNQLITSEKMASLGLLSAGIAHEINTPLTGISSYCQFLLESSADPESRELIQKVQDQVQRANKIVRTLLDFSRKKMENPIAADLRRIVEDSIALVEHQLKKKNIHIHLEMELSRTVTGFPTRLQQLFINLILNAVDALDEGGEIRISAREAGDEVRIDVADNGRGIPGKVLDKIFDPFFTTKDIGKGTGLGLAIVYSIVKEHYGEITVSSREGRGTVFSVVLPFASPLRSMQL